MGSVSFVLAGDQIYYSPSQNFELQVVRVIYLERRRINYLAASGQTESNENANTELANHFMALEGNTMLPQHKPQKYREEAKQ